jgi:hypothetical protein
LPYTLVSTEEELTAALADGGEIRVDSSVVITLSQTMDVIRPTKLIGGTFAVDTGTAFQITSSDVEFYGARIAGGGIAAGHDGTQTLIHAAGTATSPLSNVNVNDCHLSGSRADNIWLDWCVESTVSNNTIREFLYSAVMVVSGTRVTIIGNQVSDSPLLDAAGSPTNCYGIAVTDIDNTEQARSRNVLVTGNRVHAIDWEGIDTHGGDGITITGNTITACPRGIALVTGNSTRTTAPTRCVVSGNNVDGVGARQTVREGIWLGGMANVPADGVVTGNLVTGYGDKTFVTPYVDRGKMHVGGNQPAYMQWSPITLDGDFTANSTYTPEYKIDGNTSYLRGGVIPKSGSQRKVIGHLANPHARPEVLSFVGYTKGSNPSAGNGMVGVWPDGTIELFYSSGTDTYTYFLSGSYEAA